MLETHLSSSRLHCVSGRPERLPQHQCWFRGPWLHEHDPLWHFGCPVTLDLFVILRSMCDKETIDIRFRTFTVSWMSVPLYCFIQFWLPTVGGTFYIDFKVGTTEFPVPKTLYQRSTTWTHLGMIFTKYCDWKDTKHIFSSFKTEKFITGRCVGVQEDYQLRDLRDSHTLGWSWNWNTQR